MGTRAVVHVDLRPVGYGKDIWIATHLDGNPENLGKDLRKEIAFQKNEFKRNFPSIPLDMGSILQKAVARASALHNIDLMSVDGKGEFPYGDYADYQYEVDAKTGKVKVRTLQGEWGSSIQKIGKWKQLSKVI